MVNSVVDQQAVLEKMLELSRRMAETRVLSPLLQTVMDESLKLVGGERGYLVLVSGEGEIGFRVRCGPDTEKDDQISRSIVLEVIRSGKSQVIGDAMSDPKWNRSNSVHILRLRSVLCVPLVAHGQTIGAIYVENRMVKGRFHEADIWPLELLGNQAAVCIENAVLNEDLEGRVAERTAEVDQAWKHAVEANAVRTTLLGNLAHDLRAPASLAIQSVGLALDNFFGPVEGELREWLVKARDSMQQVLRLTNDVFDLSKMEAGGLSLYPEETGVGDLLSAVHSMAVALPWGPEVSFELKLPDGELPRVVLDRQRIGQVLMNLLGNAGKFTRTGSVTLFAEYVAAADRVLIGVADTGDGIAEDLVGKLFQRFQQVDGNVDRRRRGSGLGLAICRELVEMHGGRIWVESKVGQGSKFQFELPLRYLEPGQAPSISS